MKKKKLCLTLILLSLTFLSISLFPSSAFAQNTDPQYIFVRKDPMCDPSNCYQWNLNDPNQINMESINEIFNKVGTKGNRYRKLGIAVQLLAGLYPVHNLQTSLQQLLEYSIIHDFPVFIQLDSYQFWHNLPQLWNWWDPNISNEEMERRKNNVDWTCWESSCAIKTAWRNWGVEFEIGTPPPNYSSQAVLDAHKNNFRGSLLIIANWYNNLPQDKKYLLGGISIGNELDVGWNYYYYPSGIKPDETILNSCRGSFGETWKCTVQLGYNSVKTAGIKSSGQLTTNDLNEVIKRYLTTLNKFAVEIGIPRNKIFNQVGGKGIMPQTFPDNLVWPDGISALNEYGTPGWSFYGGIAQNPDNYPTLITALDQIGTSEWASPEWNPLASDYIGWVTALRNSLNFRNNRFINIANWDGGQNVKDLCYWNPSLGHCIQGTDGHTYYAIDAIRTVLDETPSCWVTSPVLNSPSISGGNVTLSWQNGENNKETYLTASTVADFDLSGTLKNMNVVNTVVTGKTTYNLSSLSPGKYYWAVVADGCSPVQRRIANGQFEIGSPPTPTPNNSPPIGYFDTATGGTICTLEGWSCDPDNYNRQIKVDIWADGKYVGQTTADKYRARDNEAIRTACNNSTTDHAFKYSIPAPWNNDNTSHTYTVYGIDIDRDGNNAGNNTELPRWNTGAPGTIICSSTDSPTPSPAPVLIPGDITGPFGFRDGKVNIYDYNLLITDFGKSGSPADIDGNGMIDIYDYNTLVGNFGRTQ